MRCVLFLMCFLFSAGLYAQNKITGVVYSMETGDPLEGIEVKLAYKVSDPVYTSDDGTFEISIEPKNVWLKFTYAGYKDRTEYVTSGEDIEVFLVDENEYSTDDHIAIPFGSIRDKYFTGSREFIDLESLSKSVYSSIESRVSGYASGVRVMNNSGAPGSGSSLLIRGISTLNGGTQPLYVVDGLILRNYQYSSPLSSGANHNPLADINPDDIRSVNIIKDGAQAAFYGVRGANGVVLIETNMGNSGKTMLTLDAYTGVSMLPKKMPVLNATEYKSYFKELNYANGMSPYDFALEYGSVFYEDDRSQNFNRYNNDNNWQDLVTEYGTVQNYYLNLKGGDQVATYSFSTGFLSQEGLVSGTNMDRFTINFNMVYRISDKMRFGNVVNFANVYKNMADEGLNYHSNPLFVSLIKAPHFAPNIQSITGNVSAKHEDQDFFGMSNPRHIVSDLENKARLSRLMGSTYLDFDLVKDLKGRIDLGIDYNRQDEDRFYPDYGLSSAENADRFSESKVNTRFLLQADAYINYEKIIGNVHKFDALLGTGVFSQNIDFTYGKSINSAADYFTTLSKGQADSINSGLIQNRMVAAYTKINYAFKDRLLLEANVRIDGSSRFGDNYRYGTFPGISAGWRLSEEGFLKEIDFVNELKLKAGYGVTGNENIEDYIAFNTYSGGSYNLRGAIRPYNLGNEDLKWETTRQIDAGVLFMGARNRIGVEVDVYRKNTTDLFYLNELPSITGYAGILDNLGDIENTGIDASIFFRPLNSTFKWDTKFIFSKYKNLVTKLPSGEVKNNFNKFVGLAREGEPIGVFYGFNATGIFDTDEEAAAFENSPGYSPFRAGDIKYEDVDNNGVINESDMKIIGNPHPDFFGSFINSVSFKGINLDLNLTYSVGNEAVNTTRMYLESMSNHYNQTSAVLRAWQKTGDAVSTDVPRLSIGDPTGNTRNSSRWVEDASYLRVQLLSLSYDIPESFLNNKIGLNSLRIYLKGQNIYTFSKYLGYSPDFVSGYNPLLFGIDTGTYPTPKTFLIGVKIGL